MLYFIPIFIPAIAAADTMGIGMAAGLCRNMKNDLSKALKLAFIISIVHSSLFISGHFISTININSENLFSIAKSIYPFFLMIIGAKFMYSGLSSKKEKRSSLDHMAITYIFILLSGIDQLGAGFSIPHDFFIISLAFSFLFSFIFTIAGFIISSGYGRKVKHRLFQNLAIGNLAFGSMAIFMGIITLI